MPAFSAVSIFSRIGRDTEPWCVGTSVPVASESLRATFSASRRLLQKTSVVFRAATSLTTVSIAGPHAEPSGSERKSLAGEVTVRSSFFRASTTTGRIARPVPAAKEATTSTGATVAESAIRCGEAPPARATSSSSRSSESARWLPRLVPATEWTSSRITVETPSSARRPDPVSIR